MERFSSYENSLPLPGTVALEERVIVNPQLSLLDLTVEAGILGDVMRNL